MKLQRRELLLGASGLFVSAATPARSTPWFTADRPQPDQSVAVAAVKRSLERISDRNGVLQAVAWLNPRAIDDATRIDAAVRSGEAGPLSGLTILAKTTFDVAGAPTDGSNDAWARDFTSSADADAITVARIKDAGAVLLGKGAADDFGWGGEGLATATGQVWNPNYPDRARISGGSSGGGAAAVAAGFCDAAFGTDDGGSNRIPAHYCGVVGVKTTFGLVPRTGVIPSWPWIDCHGPIAADARTAARVLQIMAGPDQIDGHSNRADGSIDASAPRIDLATVRLGLVTSHAPIAALSSPQAEAFEGALARLKAGGAEIVEIDPPVTRGNMSERLKAPNATPFDLNACANALVRYLDRRPEGATQLLPIVLPAYQKFYSYLPNSPDDVFAMAETPCEETAKGVAYAERRDIVVSALSAFLADRKIDAMIWPTLGHDALRAGEAWPETPNPLSFANRLGIPEISTPAAKSPDGIPSGNISFVGTPFTDFRLLALAHEFEALRDG